MELMPMQYKDFIWPHNPRTYSIRYERRVAVHKVPFGRYAMQNLGLSYRVMTGEGEFWGEDAYEQFKKLATVFYREGPGTLLHPVWQTAKAYFVGLSLAQEPRKDYVRYTFTFWEDYDKYSQALTTKTAQQKQLSQSSGTGQQVYTAQVSQRTDNTTAAVPGAQYHTVKQGETLWGIAHAYGLSWGEIMAMNLQHKNPNVVEVGEVLRVR